MLDERLNIRTFKSDLLVEAPLTRAGIDKARVLNTRNKCGFGFIQLPAIDRIGRRGFFSASLTPPKLETNEADRISRTWWWQHRNRVFRADRPRSEYGASSQAF